MGVCFTQTIYLPGTQSCKNWWLIIMKMNSIRNDMEKNEKKICYGHCVTKKFQVIKLYFGCMKTKIHLHVQQKDVFSDFKTESNHCQETFCTRYWNVGKSNSIVFTCYLRFYYIFGSKWTQILDFLNDYSWDRKV